MVRMCSRKCDGQVYMNTECSAAATFQMEKLGHNIIVKKWVNPNSISIIITTYKTDRMQLLNINVKGDVIYVILASLSKIDSTGSQQKPYINKHAHTKKIRTDGWTDEWINRHILNKKIKITIKIINNNNYTIFITFYIYILLFLLLYFI